MKTILLTGASGFIGTHLLKAIRYHPQYTKYNLVLLSSQNVEGYKTILHRGYTFSKTDFAEQGVTKVDIVIHAGAFIPKNSSAADNADNCLLNILSVSHLLRELPSIPEQFIFISTVDVYATCDEVISESTSVGADTLYGMSKLYGEKIIEKWACKKNVVLQVLRLGHIYGSGEEAFEKIIPATIRKVLRKENPVIFTSGKELRSYLHVSDCVNAILASLELRNYAGPINVVSSNPLSINEIVEIIVKKISPDLKAIFENNGSHVRNFLFDSNKMKQLLHKETVSFAEGIEEEIKSFRDERL